MDNSVEYYSADFGTICYIAIEKQISYDDAVYTCEIVEGAYIGELIDINSSKAAQGLFTFA